MALKGISWIEQNCEKLVVGVFGTGLLYVVATQFLDVSSQVTFGTGKDKKSVPVEEAMNYVGKQAKTINEIITNPELPELRDIQAKLPTNSGARGSFEGRLGNVSPREALAGAIDKPRITFGGSATGGADRNAPRAQNFMYAAVKAPATSKPVGASYLATIHPIEYAKNPEVQKILPLNPLPKDKAAISLEATFDGLSYAGSLSADPDGENGPLSPLPFHWWNEQSTQVLAVELERQEMKPDGTWGEATKVKHMPGRVDLSPQIETVAANGVEAYKSLVSEAAAQAADVRHPKYYEIIFGEEWVTPTEAITILASDAATPAGSPAGDDATNAKRELAGKDAEITRQKEAIAKLTSAGEPKQPPRQPNAPPTPTPGGKSTGPGTTPPPGAKDPKAEQIKTAEARLTRLEQDRKKIIEKWSRRGVELEMEPAKPDPAAPMPAKDPKEVEPALLENQAAKIVAHDVTVERGKTYRYRTSLVFNNPIYGKVVAANSEQEKLTKEPIVHSAASDWSDPISVDADTYYFITSATPQDSLSRSSRAGAELYIFRWGYWRKAGVTVEPGDILATDVKVPDFTKQVAMLVDPMMPGTPTTPQPTPTGGKTRLPETPGTRPGETKMEDAVMFVQVPVSHDAVMLEVAPTAVATDQGGSTKSRNENHVFLRENDGTIVVRGPEGDRSSTLYRKLASSSTKGDEAVKARNAPPPDPNKPPQEPERPKNPKDNPGGPGPGGGGGG